MLCLRGTSPCGVPVGAKKQPTDVVVGGLALPSDPSNVILVCHVEGVLVVRNKQPTPRRPDIGDTRSTQCYSRGHRGDMKKHTNVSAVYFALTGMEIVL